MPDFLLVDSPPFSPTCCVVCGATKPSIDLMRELPGYGALYLCLQCVGDAARAGSVRRNLPLSNRLAEAHTTIRELNEALAHERANKTIDIRDLPAAMDALRDEFAREDRIEAAHDLAEAEQLTPEEVAAFEAEAEAANGTITPALPPAPDNDDEGEHS